MQIELTVKKYLKSFLGILYPVNCLSCNKKLPGDIPICEDCFGAIKLNKPPYCNKCSKPLIKEWAYSNICSECKKRNFVFNQAFSCCIYENTIKNAILRFKYSDSMYLLPFFKKILSDFLKLEKTIDINVIDIIIPVPLSKAKSRQRGFNQSEILSTLVGEILEKPVLKNILVKTRATRPQQELDHKKRLLNLGNVFKAINLDNIKGRNILLIDDVLTTGTTLNECAKVLKKALCRDIFALTLARTYTRIV